MAFASLEPFGGLVEDSRAGTVAATIYNMNRGPKSPAASASDFMPSLRRALHGAAEEEKKPELTPEQEAKFLDAAFGF
jgi:hypothetical protein